ncbi:response regulator receiver protein [Ktedonobacter racemifer DSM 44963]|uniref:Response regulator receiver protein n=2 Tax=Ktedonobacter racemifer TaxID=363277 RepID=D6TQV8_KTERA|nr:response regulator receiver protein [Ktedonobacter racemifer DSM 44963]
MFIEPKRDLAMREYGLYVRKAVGMRKRILVVDDDQVLRSLIQELLEEEAYEVDTAIDGVDALDRLDHQRNVYDVILLDLTMPRLNGLQFLQKVQAQDPTLLRSIIALSADKETLQQSACMGIGNTLKKPFDPEELLVLVERAMCWP